MKLILKTILLAVLGFLLGVYARCGAAPVTLAWDPNPHADKIAAYELRYGTDPANLSGRHKVGSEVTETTLDLAPGNYFFEVIAISGNGIESLPSNRVEHLLRPAPPAKLRAVEIQTSANLKDWKTIALIPQEPDEIPAEFVRARIVSLTR
jgi:hypothetical protein